MKRRDLRIAATLFLELDRPLPDGALIEVKNPSRKLWPASFEFRARLEPDRWSPVVHVNQTGYLPGSSKKAMVGYYLGSLGEMPIGGGENPAPPFEILDAHTRARRFTGRLSRRPDQGFTFPTYQEVWEADFTEFTAPGEFRLAVPGLGVSYPFWIHEGAAAGVARAYALGLYHQRCGMAHELPFTRFTHTPCHLAPAEIPTPQFEATALFLKDVTNNAKNDRRHSAPSLEKVSASLYPFARAGQADVSGGHHDAGDYSKYTINSAALIHYLVFAADAFPGASELDNLGLPESGDGQSDLLQEAKWEADFLVKMQDADGGFYFLVYPRERKYEDDVLPDQGDRQVVWPKNTAATAAAVAALAQMGSSPQCQRQFPAAAKSYLASAIKGWQFLQRAFAKHGRDGAYQKLTHYGHEFFHDDELAWAAAELFLATGDRAYERELLGHFDPSDRETRRWTWWRVFEGYGCAVRSYAFGARTGRVKPQQLNSEFLKKRQRDIVHQYAQNDRRILPPSGIPIGNIQAGFQFLHHYEKELGTVSFPPDGVEQNPYPFYDRWGDSFNVSTEFTVVNQARGLAALTGLMAQTPLKNQRWKAAAARITGVPNQAKPGMRIIAKLDAAPLDLANARIVWEATDRDPVIAREFEFTIPETGEFWIEAEAQWPDGRRTFAVLEKAQ